MASVTTTALTELGGKYVLNRSAKGTDKDSVDQRNALTGSGTIYMIEIDNEEVPILDGSAKVFIEKILSSGIKPNQINGAIEISKNNSAHA